jgi:hypothetical protein
MKKSSIIVFCENYCFSELSQIIMYLQQLAASGINIAHYGFGVLWKKSERSKNLRERGSEK